MCSLDLFFLDKTMGPSGVNWKEHFILLKKTFISSPDKYCADLLCYEWMAHVTQLESLTSVRGGFRIGFSATGP